MINHSGDQASATSAVSADSVPRREPRIVMRCRRMGAFQQTRLSFMRVLLRRLKQEHWRFERTRWDIDDQGVGVALYQAGGPQRTYTLVCFAHHLDPSERSDRVIATAWDATFVLFDGVPDDAEIRRLADNVPKQEAGRVSARELCLSRANRSVRLFDYVVAKLSAGMQPDEAELRSVGYLMRTTAVYGSGKFGAVERDAIAGRDELAGPFRAEMLAVYLIRWFSVDIAEHLAKVAGSSTAVGLHANLRRLLGVGNSTGLGMAPFLINHPVLINNWMMAREEALARVRGLSRASANEIAVFDMCLRKAAINAREWRSESPHQIVKLTALRNDIDAITRHVSQAGLAMSRPWDQLYRFGESQLSEEGQEQLVSLLLEPYGHLVDGLSECMVADEQLHHVIDGAMPLAKLKRIYQSHYAWALAIDFDRPENRARVWYTSETKLEPRLGERFEENIADYEQPLAPGHDAALAHAALAAFDDDDVVATFLLRHPEHRESVRRAQISERYPYAEVRDNTIGAALLPIDLLRCKLSFFGATQFDPRSDRWVRVSMYQGAPFPCELGATDADYWVYPDNDAVH